MSGVQWIAHVGANPATLSGARWVVWQSPPGSSHDDTTLPLEARTGQAVTMASGAVT